MLVQADVVISDAQRVAILVADVSEAGGMRVAQDDYPAVEVGCRPVLVTQEDVVEGVEQALCDVGGQVEGVVLHLHEVRGVVVAVQHQHRCLAGAGLSCVLGGMEQGGLEQLLGSVVRDYEDAVAHVLVVGGRQVRRRHYGAVQGLQGVQTTLVLRVAAVGEIEPGHVHAGLQHLPQDALPVRGRTEGAHDLCLSHK